MLTRSSSDSRLYFDPEIELTLRNLRKDQRNSRDNRFNLNNMAQPERRTLGDFAMPDISGTFGGIVAPTIANNNFEIKPSIIHMVQNNQFGGLQGEDPYAHILTFLNVCATFKINGVTDDAIRLRLFPFSVKDKAQLWLASLPSESITTWDQLKQAFLHKYFPPHKTAKFRNEITTFKQNGSETIYSAWEIFKELQRQCPHHSLPEWMIP